MDPLNHYKSVLESQPMLKENWISKFAQLIFVNDSHLALLPGYQSNSNVKTNLFLAQTNQLFVKIFQEKFRPTWFYSSNVIFQRNWPKWLFILLVCLTNVNNNCIGLLFYTWFYECYLVIYLMFYFIIYEWVIEI